MQPPTEPTRAAPQQRPVPRGDEDEHYRRHHRELHRAVAHAVRAPRELIEDACQTAWAILMRCQPDRYAPFGWLRVVAIHEAYGGRILFSGERERCPFCMDLLDHEQLRQDTMTPAIREAHDRIYGVHRDALRGSGPRGRLDQRCRRIARSHGVHGLAHRATSAERAAHLPGGQGGVRVSRDAPLDGCPYCRA